MSADHLKFKTTANIGLSPIRILAFTVDTIGFYIRQKIVAFCLNIAYNICEPKGSQRVFRRPYPKCEALQQVFRHLYPKCGALTIRGDANPLVFCERKEI